MKKGMLAMCAVVLILFGWVSLVGAEERFDMKSFSDEEILAFSEAVNNEIVSRGIMKCASVPAGKYIAGRDLPAGSYMFTCMAVGEDWGNVTVYSEGGKGEQLLWEVMIAPEEGEEPEKIFIHLEEGDQLSSQVPFSLTVMPGILFR